MDSLPLWLVSVGAGALLLVLASRLSLLLRWQRVLTEVAIALFIVGFVYLFMANLSLLTTVLLGVVNVMLILLASRLIFGRLDKQFLHGSTVLNVFTLLAVIMLAILGNFYLPAANIGWLFGLLTCSLMVGALFLLQTLWAYGHYRVKRGERRADEKYLPTVSLCIPARNETSSLADCLVAAVASDYPKLEVLVLDDCSQDKTSEIIRGFAHSGVRFIKGDVPATGWLGRNQAMSTLAQQASGELLIFMSVDTVLSPASISQMVTYAQGRASMVSVLPHSHQGFSLATVLAPLRYYWQLVFPISKRHVPISTMLWMIGDKGLHGLGGFESVKHKIVPEESFASRLFAKNSYRFLFGDDALGVTTTKTWRDQIRSSVRLLYPTLKRQPVYALAAVAVIVGLLGLPYGLIAANALTGQFDTVFWLSVLAVAIFMLSYGLIMARLQPLSWLTSTLLLPVLLLQEVALIVISMLAYEFSEVDWKGRNVCYPVISRGQRSAPQPGEIGQPRRDSSVLSN